MKEIIFLCLFLFAFGKGNAQQTTKAEGPFKHELGINVSRFIQRYLFVNGDNGYYDLGYPYLLDYRLSIGTKHLFRFSLDGDYEKRDDTGSQNSNPMTPRESYLVNFRAGYFRSISIAKRWEVFFGEDLFYKYYRSKIVGSNNNNYNLNTKNKVFGGGGTLGFSFKLNNRFLLSTESSLYLALDRGKEIRTKSADPDFEQVTENKGTNIDFYTPLDIRFAFRF